MPLTKSFRDTVKKRAQRDPEFRDGLYLEAMQAFLRGETAVAKLLLRDYINATEGFESVAGQMGKNPKSVMRMLSDSGNPTLSNVGELFTALQPDSDLVVSLKRTKKSRKKKLTRKKVAARKKATR